MIKGSDYVLLTANAGVLINYRNKKILVDALHDDSATRFSWVPEVVLQQVVSGEGPFSNTDVVLVTHDHPDHYSKKWTKRLLERNPGIQAVMPMQDFADRKNVHVLSRPKEEIRVAGVEITCKRLRHDGPQYASVTNYGYMLNVNGLRIMLLGDGEIDEEAITAFMDGFVPDLALLNFPFLALQRGREIMQRIICAKQTIFYHLPEPADDSNGYTRATQKIFQRKYPNDPSMSLLYKSMHKVPIRAAVE